jgi:hypothetical protein
MASEAWEIDQEKAKPIYYPRYQPTAEVLLLRYLKTLIWLSMTRRLPYGLIALGCCLYSYTPEDIKRLNEELDRPRERIYGPIVQRLKERFPRLLLEPDSKYPRVALRAPTQGEREVMVPEGLTLFAPWRSSEEERPPGTLLEDFMCPYEPPSDSEKSKKSLEKEREQVYALLNPSCVGLPRLINYFNDIEWRPTMRLDPPDDKLGVPNLPPPGSSSGRAPQPSHPFQPPPLSPDHLKRLEDNLAERRMRRQQMRPEWLSVAVDSCEAVRYPVEGNPSHEILVPRYASYLQIYGHDTNGELLLAVIPLAEEPKCVDISVGGHTLTLDLQPHWTATGELEPYRIQLTYDMTAVRGRPLPHKPLFPWHSDDRWHPLQAGELVTADAAATQSSMFDLGVGRIQVTCRWWDQAPGYPAVLLLTWHADVSLVGELWVRFTRLEATTVVLAEVPLGSALAGERVFTKRELGFDLMREPWALTPIMWGAVP